jgi:hypothetical protein
LQNLFAYNMASLYRTAFNTIPAWKYRFADLKNAAEEHLHLADLARGHLSPQFWDSQPFVQSLETAIHAFPAHPMHDTWQPQLEKLPKLRNSKLQSQVYAVVNQTLNSCDLANVLKNRTEVSFKKHGFHPAATISYEKWKEIVLSLRNNPSSYLSMCVLKGLLNAWTTKDRFQKRDAPCLFCGLVGGDKWLHYVYCGVFWDNINSSIGISKEHTCLKCRVGICQLHIGSRLEVSAIFYAALAFYCYHALRHETQVSSEKLQVTAQAFSKSFTEKQRFV